MCSMSSSRRRPMSNETEFDRMSHPGHTTLVCSACARTTAVCQCSSMKPRPIVYGVCVTCRDRRDAARTVEGVRAEGTEDFRATTPQRIEAPARPPVALRIRRSERATQTHFF